MSKDKRTSDLIAKESGALSKAKKDSASFSVDIKTKKLLLLKNKFESMDFSLRERINNKFIEHLQMSGKFTLPQLMQRHIDKNKTQKIIKDIFPPDNFEYQQIEDLNKRMEECSEEFDLDHEVSSFAYIILAIFVIPGVKQTIDLI